MRRDIFRTITLIIIAASLGASPVHAEWVEGGIAACTDTNRQISPCAVTDGGHGAIITWGDTRGGNGDIYGQLIGPYGELSWDSLGVVVCSKDGNQYPHCSISDGAGGTITAWVDQSVVSSTSISLQRINERGENLWDSDGIRVCPISMQQDSPRLAADGAHGAIAVWEDFRESSWKIFAQRFDLNGSRLWDTDGIKISDHSPHDHFIQVIPHDISGAIILWLVRTAEVWTLYAQGLATDGSLRWNSEVVIASKTFDSGARTLKDFSSTADGCGGAIVAWYEGRADYPTYRIYAQRIDANGRVRWEPEGLLLYFTGWWCDSPRIVRDGSDGAIVVWEAGEGNTYWQYAQRIDSSGTILWKERGVETCYTANYQNGLRLTSDGAGGAISVWSEERTPGHYDIIAQRIDGNGDHQWTVTGRRICDAAGSQVSPALIPDGAGGMIAAWQDRRHGAGRDRIYAQRIDSESDIPLVTELESYLARVDGFDIAVEWVLAHIGKDVEFSISRVVEPDTVFRDIADARFSIDGLAYTFIDRDLEPATMHRYRVDITDDEGEKTLFITDPVTTPFHPLTLYQNYPNPFNPQTTIFYYLPEPGRVILEIYNVSGKKIVTVLDEWRDKGRHRDSWNGSDAKGKPAASGVYYCRLVTETGSSQRKVVILR